MNTAALTDPTPPDNLALVSAGISGGILTVRDSSSHGSSFLGSALVAFTAGSTTYNLQVTFTDAAPAWTAPANQSVTLPTATQTSLLGLSAVDAAGNAVSYTAQVAGYNPLFNVEQQYDLQAPSSSYYFNARGGGEKYLVSGNGGNSAGAGYYIVIPGGNLYAFTGSLSSSETAGNFIASLGASAYADPTTLIDAVPAYNPTVWTTQQTLALQATSGNDMFNMRGAQEKYLASNGSLYFLLPGGGLYAWDGKSLTTSVEAGAAAMLPNYCYLNPTYLTSPAQKLTGLTPSVGGGGLTVSDVGFQGTASVCLTGSDGAMSSTQTFQVTFTDTGTVTLGISTELGHGGPRRRRHGHADSVGQHDVSDAANRRR